MVDGEKKFNVGGYKVDLSIHRATCVPSVTVRAVTSEPLASKWHKLDEA